MKTIIIVQEITTETLPILMTIIHLVVILLHFTSLIIHPETIGTDLLHQGLHITLGLGLHQQEVISQSPFNL
jgi:hypothetical protein